MVTFNYTPGATPVLVNMPHAGTYIPPALEASFAPVAFDLVDTDWHLDVLYEWVQQYEVHVIQATHSRYVIDLNRPPDNTPLYATPTTSLCPAIQFDGTPLYKDQQIPTPSEIKQRRQTYWAPYHRKLRQVLNALQRSFGFAILLDAHSIQSRVPRLFEGQLPDLNLGTHAGRSAHPDLIQRASNILSNTPNYSFVQDGRFKGGYITRHYGAPSKGIHALQLELTQRLYMEEYPPFQYDAVKATPLQIVLRMLIQTLVNWHPNSSK